MDPKAMVRSAITRVAALKYPTPERAAQAAVYIDAIEHSARDLVYQVNLPALRKLLRDFEDDAQRLTLAPSVPAPSWDEHIRYWAHRSNWTVSDLSLDKFWPFLEDNRATKDRIIGVSDDAVTMASGASISRRRLGLPPIQKPIILRTMGPADQIGQRLPE
jgi:hypothetical protein